MSIIQHGQQDTISEKEQMNELMNNCDSYIIPLLMSETQLEAEYACLGL